jgi:hypothetical protein
LLLYRLGCFTGLVGGAAAVAAVDRSCILLASSGVSSMLQKAWWQQARSVCWQTHTVVVSRHPSMRHPMTVT